MADILADVIRLFIAEALFVAGSKKGQAGVATDTQRWLIHDLTSDTLAFGVSDDALQCLLAGAQTLSGQKTFTLPILLASDGSIGINSGSVELKQLTNNDMLIQHSNTGDINIQATSGNYVFKAGGSPNNVSLESGVHLLLPASTTSKAPLRISDGVAPTSPLEGEFWKTATDLIARVNGVSESLLANASTHMLLAGVQSATGKKTFGAGADVQTRLGVNQPSPLYSIDIRGDSEFPTARLDARSASNLIPYFRTNADRPNEGDIAYGLAVANNDAGNIAEMRILRGTTDLKGVLEFWNSGLKRFSVDQTGQFILEAPGFLRINNDKANPGDLAGGVFYYNDGASAIVAIRIERGTTDLQGEYIVETSNIERFRIDEDGIANFKFNALFDALVLFDTDASIGLNSGSLEIKQLTNNDMLIQHSNTGDVNIHATSGNYVFKAGGSANSVTLESGVSLNLPASTTSKAPLNIPAGSAPTSPDNGDIWLEGTTLKYRAGGTTYTVTAT